MAILTNKPVKSMTEKKILRSSTTKAINLPPEVWKEAGWKLNDEVELVVCENHSGNENNDIWKSISIDRIEDLEKYCEVYNENVEKLNKERE